MPKATKPEPPPVVLRYFELGDRFWEIGLGETTITARHGKVGSPGQTKVKEYDAYYEATWDARKQVTSKIKAGYVEKVGQPPVARTNPALEKAIIANPTDDAAYLVYADWLQSHDDPRGELIALQSAGKTKPAQKLLAQHADYFLGPLHAHQQCHDGHDKKLPAFTWKNGFIHAARLAHNQYADSWKGQLATDVLLPLLIHPSGKFLVELTLNENDDPSEDTLDDLFAMIAKHPIPALRKLRIGDEVSQISWFRIGNLGPIWKALPNLTHLDIEAGQFELGAIEAPNLVHAVFRTGGLSKTAARSIAQAKWPKLEHLEVFFGDPQYGCTAKLKDALAILERSDLSKLRHLGLKNAEFQADLVPHLASSKLVRQLHTLDMSYGILLDEHVDGILQHADAFKHLEVLDVSATWLTPKAVKRLKGVAKKVICENSWNDANPEYRYVAVGE
jgi:uncharacterized protein (TIGR02996 family)